MKAFNKVTCKVLRAALEEAVKSVEETHKIKIKIGNMGYSANGDNVSIKVEAVAEGGNDKYATDYNRYRSMHNLPRLGTIIQTGGKVFKLVGFKPRATKYPVIAQDENGDRFRLPIDVVQYAEIIEKGNK